MRPLLLTLLFLLTGCGSSSILGDGPTTRADLLRQAPPELAQVNEAMARGRFVISLEGGRGIREVRSIVVGIGVSRYREAGSTQWHSLDTADIVRVDRMGYGRDAAGATRGAAVGGFPGALLMLLALGADDEPSLGGPSRAVGIWMGAGLSVLGGAIGWAYGGRADRVESVPYRAPMSDYLTPTDFNFDRSERR